MLDPIDGTKGFVKAAQYAVALGMLVDGQVRCHGSLLCHKSRLGYLHNNRTIISAWASCLGELRQDHSS